MRFFFPVLQVFYLLLEQLLLEKSVAEARSLIIKDSSFTIKVIAQFI